MLSQMSRVSTPSISEHEIDSANLYHTPPMSSTPYTSVGGTPFSRMGGVIRPAQISSYRHTRMCRDAESEVDQASAGALELHAFSARPCLRLSFYLSVSQRLCLWGPRSRPDRPQPR